MTLSDYLLIAAIACAVVAAVCRIRKRRKKGGCDGDCSHCCGCH